ncbi:MAG: LacI family transcriptional regulator [Actinomycetia bacterium]|nr:LacI family transcriptional regulator [Actinomycetes bacterium]
MAKDDRRRATMRDVAHRAGVSIKTVSRVVNGEPNVAEATIAKVREATEALRYLPDAAAANLARGVRDTRSIALLISAMDNPFYASIFRGVEEVATLRGVVVFAASTHMDLAKEAALVAAFMSRRVDGFVVVPAPGDHRGVADLLGTHLPCVYVDCAPEGIAADVVTADNRAAARTATRHLLAGGHRRIGFLGDDAQLSTAADRLAGYRDELGRAGIVPADELVELGVLVASDAEAGTARLLGLDDPPTALFASRNMAAIGAMRILKQRGLSHRVALVGMDEMDMSDLVDPALSVMAQDPRGFGSAAAQRLFQRIDGLDEAPATLIVPARLIERGSGEIRAPS